MEREWESRKRRLGVRTRRLAFLNGRSSLFPASVRRLHTSATQLAHLKGRVAASGLPVADSSTPTRVSPPHDSHSPFSPGDSAFSRATRPFSKRRLDPTHGRLPIPRGATRGEEGHDSHQRVAPAGADSPLRDAPCHYRVPHHTSSAVSSYPQQVRCFVNPGPSPGNGGELETSLSRRTRNLARRHPNLVIASRSQHVRATLLDCSILAETTFSGFAQPSQSMLISIIQRRIAWCHLAWIALRLGSSSS